MITLFEQYGFKNPKTIDGDISYYYEVLNGQNYSRYFGDNNDGNICYQIRFENKGSEDRYLFESSYFIGVDWIVENKLPVHITPKLNKENKEINYLKMLSDALSQTSSVEHLEDLFEIDFKKPMIKIPQSRDLLTPLLIVQFLHLLKKIVKKGLKKSYYKVEQNSKSKVRGKILISQTINKNHSKGVRDKTYCSFEMYGIDSIENRILKKTLHFVRKIMNDIPGFNKNEMLSMYNYIFPAFANVSSEIEERALKNHKASPMFKEYKLALELSQLILKKYGYNISNINSTIARTPPFWIDMSKLFELYVFAKLKAVFRGRNEVRYQYKAFYRELDYLIKSNDGKYKMVVDAKYKLYAGRHIEINDLRQISAYARMTKVYSELQVENDKNIDCLIIYPNQANPKSDFHNVELNDENFKVNNYVNIYKIGISLPEICV